MSYIYVGFLAYRVGEIRTLVNQGHTVITSFNFMSCFPLNTVLKFEDNPSLIFCVRRARNLQRDRFNCAQHPCNFLFIRTWPEYQSLFVILISFLPSNTKTINKSLL